LQAKRQAISGIIDYETARSFVSLPRF